MQDRRILIPICAAIVLAIICTARLATNRHQEYADQVAVAIVMRPAPGFEALDSENHLFRLGSFLGRYKIIVVFFNGETGAVLKPELGANAEAEPKAESEEITKPVDRVRLEQLLADLIRLRDRHDELQSHGVKVVAVGDAIPQLNRATMQSAGTFPFPLVSDFDPSSPEGVLRIHKQWGCWDAETDKPRTGIFLVDRKGQIAYGVDGPKPLENVDRAIDAALK